MHKIAPAKVTPPRLESTIERARLFAGLESARTRPVVWLEAPPGAGKTILVASYLAAKGSPYLWYRLDSTDTDIGSFFHHLTVAAGIVCGASASELPRLGVEHVGGLGKYSRNYFRQLFERIPYHLIVFDDFQEVAADASLREVLAIGMTELTEGQQGLFLSRSSPPAEFAHLQSTQSLEVLDPQAFLIAEEEAKALCDSFGERHGLQISSEVCASLHRRCGGWITGLVLMLEARRTRGFPLDPVFDAVPEVVFEYFASEILSRTELKTEQVLLSTSMLDEISVQLAVTLSGVDDADRRLHVLSRSGYFTVRHEGNPPSYSYHDLFRRFLSRRAADRFGDEGWSSLQRRAATELAAAGHVEHAIALHRRLGDWQSIVPLLSNLAPILLAQGRHGSVLQWIEDMPAELLEGAPWLLYWVSSARMALDPSLASEGFEKAFQRFLANGDVRGTYLAWAMSVQNIFFEQADYRLFDQKIEELEPLLKRFDLPDETAEAFVFTSLALCVLWHSLDHPSRDHWIERALDLEEKLPDTTSRVQLLTMALSAFIFSGETTRRRRVLNVLPGLVESLPKSSLANILFRGVLSLNYYLQAEFDSAVAAVEESLAAAEAIGTDVTLPLTLSVGVLCASSLGDKKLLDKCLAKMEESLDPRRRHDYAFTQLVRSFVCFLDGDWPATLSWVERASITLEELGVPVFSAMCDIMRGITRSYAGDPQGGLKSINRARERVGAHGRWLLFGAAMAEAEIELRRGNRDAALSELSKAFTMGRELELWNFSGWRSDTLSRLCAEALAAGIEVPYTLSLIRKHRLLPPEPGQVDLDNWPWMVAVHTLGGFELSISGEPVTFSGKTPRMPLLLLELLVVRGGHQVPEDWLADALWPDAEGDAAAQTLSTTIRRLRQLLGVKGLLIRQNRCLTVDRRRCWVDAWALNETLQTLTRLEDAGSTVSAVERVLDRYRGAFMPQSNHPTTLGYRDSLHQRTFTVLSSAIDRVRAASNVHLATALTDQIRSLRDRVVV